MEKNIQKNEIKAEEQVLNFLFFEILTGCREDLDEAATNVGLYMEKLFDPSTSGDQKLLYGPLYNDSLKIKGSARDRQLKFLNMFKDRVTRKEIIESSKGDKDSLGGLPDPSKMNQWIDQLKMEESRPIIILPE